MFKELDLEESTSAGPTGANGANGAAASGAPSSLAGGAASFADVAALGWRVLDVLFYDVQLAAAVLHGNRMMEAATQLAFRGYEEARVALTTLLFNVSARPAAPNAALRCALGRMRARGFVRLEGGKRNAAAQQPPSSPPPPHHVAVNHIHKTTT